MALFALASCEHEVDNYPETRANTAIPRITIAEGQKTYVDFTNLATASVTYVIDVNSTNNVKSMDVKLVYIKGKVKDTTDFAVVTKFPSNLILNNSIFAKDSKGVERTIEAGDKFYIYADNWVLANGTVCTPQSTYKVKGVDEDGKEIIEDFVVNNIYADIKNDAFYHYANTIYVTAEPHGIYSGEYTVTLDGEAVLQDKVVTWIVDGPNLTCSHLLGDLIGIQYGSNYRSYVNSKLIDLGQGIGIKFLSTTSGIFPQLPVNTLDITVDMTTKVITVDYADDWGGAGLIVFTPKK